MNSITNFFTALRPYEFTIHDNIDMYDHMTYYRDVNVCNREMITLISGNVIKNYRCDIVNKYEINNA